MIQLQYLVALPGFDSIKPSKFLRKQVVNFLYATFLPFLHLPSHIISKLRGLKGWACSKVQEMKLLLVLNFHLETPFAHLEIHTLISLSLSPQKTYSPQGEKETWPGRVRWIQYKYMVRLNHAKFSVIWFVILTSNILQWLHSMKQTTCPHRMISSKKPTTLKAFPTIFIKATAGNAPAGHKESHFRCDAQHFWRDLQSLVATTIPNQSRKRLFFFGAGLICIFLRVYKWKLCK